MKINIDLDKFKLKLLIFNVRVRRVFVKVKCRIFGHNFVYETIGFKSDIAFCCKCLKVANRYKVSDMELYDSRNKKWETVLDNTIRHL